MLKNFYIYSIQNPPPLRGGMGVRSRVIELRERGVVLTFVHDSLTPVRYPIKKFSSFFCSGALVNYFSFPFLFFSPVWYVNAMSNSTGLVKIVTLSLYHSKTTVNERSLNETQGICERLFICSVPHVKPL